MISAELFLVAWPSVSHLLDFRRNLTNKKHKQAFGVQDHQMSSELFGWLFSCIF